MGPFVLAWLTGEGIIIYRTAKIYSAPPGPGQLILSSGLFAMLSLIAESEKARTPVTIVAWGVVIASFMNLFANAPTKIGQAFGNVAEAVVTGKSQHWPPGIATNTVVIPDGTSASSQSSTSSSGNSSSNGIPKTFTPNLTQ
jgi:HAMP domain-containing protein